MDINSFDNQGILSGEKEIELQQECSIQVEEEVKAYLATEKQPAESTFDHRSVTGGEASQFLIAVVHSLSQ